MRKLYCLTAIFFSFYCDAQDRAAFVTGTVQDRTNKGMVGISLSLYRVSDSSMIASVASGNEGKYSFERIAAGEYFIVASSVGYEKAGSSKFTVQAGSSATVPVLYLQEITKGLTGVTVTAKRPFIETKIDKTVVNVDASPTSAGATALEVLEKSPGVTVDNDGAISLRGKAGVIVMMDGKQTFLSATDLANLLKNMPASSIDQIEIMTNPSSRYDAAGNSGIINIKTKKGRAAGFNGSIMLGLTTSFYERDGTSYLFPKMQNSFTFNYRKNKINFFGNYNPNASSGGNAQQIDRTILDENKQVLGFNEIESRFRVGNNNHTLKLGLDYFADKKNTLGVVVSGFTFSGHPTPKTITRQYDAQHQLMSSMVSLTSNRVTFNNLTTNINFRHLFDSTGRELTIDADYTGYNNTSKMLLTTDFYNANNQLISPQLQLKGVLPSKIDIYSMKADYVHPLKNGGRVEAGMKTSVVKNDNLIDYLRWDGIKWVNDARSNHFIYDENINAVYLNANRQVKKWSFQAGLRLENTIARGFQANNDSVFKRNFTNLFPSAFISYELDKQNQFTISYSRRITRPNYQDLNPFIFFLDSLSYRTGNPFLLPQFTHNIELSHSFKNRLITTLNYNTTNDVISRILKPDGNIIFMTPDNVARFRNIGVAITAPIPVTKWWNLNLFTNIYNNYYKGSYAGSPLEIGYTSFMINMTQTFTIRQGFNVEVSGFYRAKTMDQLSINQPMYVLNFGAQKQVLKGKGTVRLNLRDPFWLQRFDGKVQYDLVDTRTYNRWDNRQVTATFTYRFGKNAQQNTPPRKRNSASEEEQIRLGQGGS